MYFLSKQQLKNLKIWKYSVIDNSITGEFLNPFWDNMLNWIPTYISPNLLTSTGLICDLFIWWLAENFYSPIMIIPIIFFYCLISTIDGLDGKQARRINNSTAFGELFDHSVDIVTLFIITRITTIVLDMAAMNLVPIYIVIGIVFCQVHYQACIDGYMKLSRYTGPNEMLFLIICLYFGNFFINFKIILASELVYNVCFCIPGLLFLYFIYCSSFTVQYIEKHNLFINKDIIQFVYLINCVNILNEIVDISHLVIVCIFIMVNAELILAKMSKSSFRKEILYLSILSIIHPYLAILITIMHTYITFTEIKLYLELPFLFTF